MNSLVRVASSAGRSLVSQALRSPAAPVGVAMTISHRGYVSTTISAEQKDRIDSMLKDKSIVVFMKGVPSAPLCGFSNAVCKVLGFHGIDAAGEAPPVGTSGDVRGTYHSYNVIEDAELRENIKLYSNWPTIPQVYFKGELIGGCDVMMDMHKSGELVEELQKIGIHSALLDANEPLEA